MREKQFTMIYSGKEFLNVKLNISILLTSSLLIMNHFDPNDFVIFLKMVKMIRDKIIWDLKI